MLKWEACEQRAKEADARGDKEAAARLRELGEKRKEKALSVLPVKIAGFQRRLERERKAGNLDLVSSLEGHIASKQAVLDSISPHVSPVTRAARETADEETETDGDIDE